MYCSEWGSEWYDLPKREVLGKCNSQSKKILLHFKMLLWDISNSFAYLHIESKRKMETECTLCFFITVTVFLNVFVLPFTVNAKVTMFPELNIAFLFIVKNYYCIAYAHMRCRALVHICVHINVMANYTASWTCKRHKTTVFYTSCV